LAGNRPVLFWPVHEYLVIYRVRRKCIEVVAIVHAARDVPALLDRLNVQ
jgi:hypothetical protein